MLTKKDLPENREISHHKMSFRPKQTFFYATRYFFRSCDVVLIYNADGLLLIEQGLLNNVKQSQPFYHTTGQKKPPGFPGGLNHKQTTNKLLFLVYFLILLS
jgi:hypothetical protein